MKAKKNHYETLGVERDASPETIKKAYRAKAQKAHPDKGGDPEEMAAVNAAYDCLSSPIRKQLYDTTGQERAEQPINEEAVGLLREAIVAVLNSDAPGTLFHEVQCILADRRSQIQAALAGYERQKAKLEKKRGKVLKKKSKKQQSTPNLFEEIIETQLWELSKGVNRAERGVAVFNAALVMLNDYESREESVETFSVVIRGNISGSWSDSTIFR